LTKAAMTHCLTSGGAKEALKQCMQIYGNTPLMRPILQRKGNQGIGQVCTFTVQRRGLSGVKNDAKSD